MDHFLINDASI